MCDGLTIRSILQPVLPNVRIIGGAGGLVVQDTDRSGNPHQVNALTSLTGAKAKPGIITPSDNKANANAFAKPQMSMQTKLSNNIDRIFKTQMMTDGNDVESQSRTHAILGTSRDQYKPFKSTIDTRSQVCYTIAH